MPGHTTRYFDSFATGTPWPILVGIARYYAAAGRLPARQRMLDATNDGVRSTVHTFAAAYPAPAKLFCNSTTSAHDMMQTCHVGIEIQGRIDS